MKQITIQNTGFLRLPEVLKIFPVSRSTWWAGVKSGIYPKPVRLSKNIVAWRVQDILALVEKYNGHCMEGSL